MTRFYRLLALPAVTYGLLLLPIIVFGVYFFALRYNIPWFDEYENIPFFLTRFVDAPTWDARIEALLRPNNEHRLLYQRLVVYGQYLLTGGIDFNALMLWGNLGFVVILYLFYRTLHRQGLPLVYLLPVPPVLFIAQNYLLTFTALYTLQYLAIIMLAFGALYLVANNTNRSFAGAAVLGVFSTFSMGNGLLLWPAGVAMLLCQRQWARLGIWVVVGAGAVYGYFYGYPVQQGNAEGFAFVTAHPVQTLWGFLIYAGSLLDLMPAWPLETRTWLPLAGGIVLVGFLVGWALWVVFRSLRQRRSVLSHFDGFMLGCVLFLLANILLIAFFRIRFGFMMVLWSSYRTYILVLWAVAYLIFIQLLPEQTRMRWLPVLWLFFAGICTVSYVTYVPEAIDRRHNMQGLTFNQRYSQIGLGGSRNSELARFIDTLTVDVERRGWYALPKPALAPGEDKLLGPVGDTTTGPELTLKTTPDFVTVRSNDPGYTVDLSRETYVVFKSSQRVYVMAARRPPLTGLNPRKRLPGFVTEVPTAMIQPGRYQLGLLRTFADRSEVQFTNVYTLIN
ncbi:MAG: hypothetical protein H7Z72_05795 [Bacteroidetes bacterium]|nr:hypothetical protein [Fibrella sp.]